MLYDIITELAQEMGRDLNVAKDRVWLLQQINHAAKEIYMTDDLVGCEREQVFNIGTTDQQIAIPWYSESIIGVRRYEYRDNIQQVDFRPRYSRGGWKKPYLQYPYHQWRQKGDSALSRNLTDEAALTLTLPDGVNSTTTFSVFITGTNSQSARVSEEVVFIAGDHTKTTVNFFSDVKSIQKSAPTTYDLSITDVSGAEVSNLPSHLKSTRFNLVQVLDRGETQSEDQLVEVLFKSRFEPFVLDTDVFTAGDIYEKCVYWKALEHFYAKLDGKEERAAMAGAKSATLLSNIVSNLSNSIEMEVEFGRNPTMECFKRSRYDMFNNFGYSPGIYNT